MEKSSTHTHWIIQGYHLFSQEGLEGLKVERLARSLSLNKSGFYHYFGDRDTFLQHLMMYHRERGSALAEDFATIKEFDPEFFSLLMKYKNSVLVHMQLVRYREIPLFKNVYEEINESVESALQPAWAMYLGMPHQTEFARKYFAQARDMFYSKITQERMNELYLRNLLGEVKGLIQEIIR